MSEMTLQPGLSNGLEPTWLAVESLCRRLELAPLNHEGENLTEGIEAMMERQVARCASRLSDMQSFWKTMWRSVGRLPGTTSNSGGREVQGYYDLSIAEIESTRNHVEKCERILGSPLGLKRVDEVLAQARQMREDLATNWLWFTKEAEDEAKASIARGEGVDVEEAFAEIMGLTVEEVRAKVEAHQRKYHPTGNGAR
ncbi:MAG TPA: hypothetical protein DDY78_20375 [Planctomycetales bacterium]|jgi:hypothetical protein|nr:hypothetical protein [Planctomycetales bacterium]